MKRTKKPTHRCYECDLNLGDHCGIYPEPRQMWRHRPCPGYKNSELVDRFRSYERTHPLDSAKAARRRAAQERNSQPHWQGNLPLVNR
jgi:hypothetical protein